MLCVPLFSHIPCHTDSCADSKGSSTSAIVVGALITFVAVAYSSVRTSSKSQLGKLGMSNEAETSLLEDTYDSDDEESGGQRVIDNEKGIVAYNWTFFHLTFAAAALYLMQVLTEWVTFQYDSLLMSFFHEI